MTNIKSIFKFFPHSFSGIGIYVFFIDFSVCKFFKCYIIIIKHFVLKRRKCKYGNYSQDKYACNYR